MSDILYQLFNLLGHVEYLLNNEYLNDPLHDYLIKVRSKVLKLILAEQLKTFNHS